MQKTRLLLLIVLWLTPLKGFSGDRENLLAQGEKLFCATLYAEALPCYLHLFNDLTQANEKTDSEDNFSDLSLVILRLGQLHFYLQDYVSACQFLSQQRTLIDQLPLHLNDIESESLYLYAMACRQMGQHAKAVQILQRHLALSNKQADEVHFELAMNYFHQGFFNLAQEQLAPFTTASTKISLYYLSQIYLAKIALAQNLCQQAEQYLDRLAKHLPERHDLCFEVAYLRGLTLLFQGQHKKAALLLSEALPKDLSSNMPWQNDALYHLAWAYLLLAGEEQDTERLNQLFIDTEKICRQLLEDNANHTGHQALEHYFKGCHLLYQLEKQAKEEEDKIELCQHAANEFDQALKLWLTVDNKQIAFAAQAFRNRIYALQKTDQQESLALALDEIATVKLQLPSLIEALPQIQELVYLQGLLACRLLELGSQDPSVLGIADQLQDSLKENPKGPFAEDIIYLLGNFHLRCGEIEQAETFFAKLIDEVPTTAHLDKVLYWWAHCAEKLNLPIAKIKQRRQNLYENYPDSPLAAASYFQYYTYRDYLQGDREALKHLETFKSKFPSSPILILSYYLTGLDHKRSRKGTEGRSLRKKNLMDAIEAFLQAENHFDFLYGQKLIHTNEIRQYATIRYRSLLERALANQIISEESQGTKRTIYRQYAENLFQTINKELADQSHPFSSYLFKESPFPQIQEESLYFQLKFFIQAGRLPAAQELINQILAKYSNLNIAKGYYLSSVHYEHGLLQMNQSDYEKACEAFSQAEKCGQGGFLSTDQRLGLWIQQSLCYKALQQIDNAMLILSRAINDPAVSSLRLKAMFLRAELYELQGRHELARKQLMSTAQKGGEWGILAKKKLEQEYGY